VGLGSRRKDQTGHAAPRSAESKARLGGRNVVVKDSTLAVVSLRQRIARLTLHSVAGLVAVAAVGYSAVLAKESRALPALALIEQVSPDAISADQPAVALVSGPRAAVNPVHPSPFALTSPIQRVVGPVVGPVVKPVELAAELAKVVQEVEPAGSVVIKNRFAQDSSARWFDGRPIKPVRTMWMTVTGYSADARSCGDSADGLTATLHSVYTNGSRLVAADPTVLNYGSMLTVPGYDSGLVVPVLDCGGAIKGRRLDLLFPTHEQALNWGVKKLLVTVWGYADGLPVENPRKMR